MREYVEFEEFTPMQLKKIYISLFYLYLFLLQSFFDTFETATNFRLLKKNIFIFRK